MVLASIAMLLVCRSQVCLMGDAAEGQAEEEIHQLTPPSSTRDPLRTLPGSMSDGQATFLCKVVTMAS